MFIHTTTKYILGLYIHAYLIIQLGDYLPEITLPKNFDPSLSVTIHLQQCLNQMGNKTNSNGCAVEIFIVKHSII